MKSLNRVTLVVLLGFGMIALSLAYWSVVASDGMLARDDNPRLVEAERAIQRGTIYDRNNQPLAHTLISGHSISGKVIVKREYPHLEAVNAVGYYSLNHGVGGVETAFDALLRGTDHTDVGQAAVDTLLHRPQIGGDVRLTIDLDLQNTVVRAFGSRHGAAVLLDVPSGAVLAMVSAPSFDPTTLDNDDKSFDTLSTDPSAPLLNRVTQGLYQPGGALETVILATMLTDKLPLTMPFADATTPVQVNRLVLTCAANGSALNLKSAYAMACPFVFANGVVSRPGPAKTQDMIAAFGLLRAPTLVRFETVSGQPSTALTDITDTAQLRNQAVGQGALVVTPLQMALVAATVANHGNTITPYLVEASRSTSDTNWQALVNTEKATAVIAQEIADSIREAMLEAVTQGAAQAAAQSGQQIYGHASIAYTGPNANAWFIGFVEHNGHMVAAAVVVEGTTDTATASQIGGIALGQAIQLTAVP